MEGVDIYKSQGEEYCTCCRKQDKGYTTVVAGILRLPFCAECFEKFKAIVNQKVTKEVIGA